MKNITLLIVDDIEMNRSIIKKIFNDEYHILEASNGVEAMEIIESTSIEILITDIFMEPMNGYDLIHNIRSRDEYKKIPIIAITESDQASRKKALQAGADDLIYRPLLSGILHNRVKGLLFDGFDLNRYKMAYENNPIPFLLYHVIDRPDTPSYKIMYMNKSARETVSPPFMEDILNTDERPEQRDSLLKALRSGEVQGFSSYEADVNKWMDWTIYPDGTGLVAAMIHDISDQIKTQTAESRQQALEAENAKNALVDILSNIPCGVFVFNITAEDFYIVTANAEGCKQLDVNMEKLINSDSETILSFIHEDDLESVRAAIHSLYIPQTDISYECRIFNRSRKEYVWFSVQAHSKRQDDGRIYAFLSYRDITVEKEYAVTKMELMVAQKADKAKTEFFSRMSHDMRTPMNGILGLVELLNLGSSEEEMRNGLAQIKLSGRYLLNLLNDTLDMSVIEAGKLQLRENPINSVELMQNIISTAELFASNKGVQLKVVLPPIETDKWIPIVVDSARLEQVFLNVIANSVKYTPGKGIVEIKMETVSISEDKIVDRYTITDTGIGISQEFLPHIYEAFSQEGRLYDNNQNGTGLGLTIAKEIITQMGGTIEVKSKINEGTSVTIEMPYKIFKGKIKGVKSYSKDILKKSRILLCEDQELNAEITTKLLELEGAKVDLASNGSIGVNMFEAAEEGYYDAVLMDIRMPVMNGLDATRAIRQSSRQYGSKVVIVALTANAFDEDVEMCLLAGMDAHISKPVDTASLYETLAKLIANRKK